MQLTDSTPKLRMTQAMGIPMAFALNNPSYIIPLIQLAMEAPFLFRTLAEKKFPFILPLLTAYIIHKQKERKEVERQPFGVIPPQPVRAERVSYVNPFLYPDPRMAGIR